MTVKTIKLLTLFYAIYFIGHLGMSTVYRFGTTATSVFGGVSLIAASVALWKAAGRAGDIREMVWGIIAGFFIWCFAGEFLEQEEILDITCLKAIPVMAIYVLTTLFMVHKKYLPTGVRFALGHFGGVWLLHCILVNQTEVLQPYYPGLFSVSIPVTAVVLSLTTLFMVGRTLKASGEKAFIAYLLSSFILAWALVETLQIMQIVPDYTYYTYWNRRFSGDSGHPPFSERADKKIEQLVGRYPWASKEKRERAYTFLKQLPSPHFLDDFSSRVDEALKNRNKMNVDETLFYRIMKESFVTTTTSSFDTLLKDSVKRFKEGVSQSQHVYHSAVAGQEAASFPLKGREKIAFIKGHFMWESNDTLELACYLLNRFAIPFLSHNGLIPSLDKKLAEKNISAVDETSLCQVLKESFSASAETIFTELLRNAQQSPIEKFL